MQSVLREAFSQGVGVARAATTPVIRQILGGVETKARRNAVQMVFSQGVGVARTATTPVIRQIPGGVD